MAHRLILDTGVLVATERGRAALSEVIHADDDLVIAAVTVGELRTGIEFADEARRAARTEFLVKVLETMPIEPYDLAAAEAHAHLLAHVHRSGTQRGGHELITAATAAATRRIILTTDRNARFDELPNVECLVVDL